MAAQIIQLNSIKKLSEDARQRIEIKNHGRRLAGLPEYVIKVRACKTCGRLFESVGNTTCSANC
jgi:hypothetical protein